MRSRSLQTEIEANGLPIFMHSIGLFMRFFQSRDDYAIVAPFFDAALGPFMMPIRREVCRWVQRLDIREVLEIREILEVGAAKRAAWLHGSDELRREREAIHKALDGGEPSQESVHEWGAWEDVHLSIVKSVGNQALVDMYRGLLDRILRIRGYYGQRFTQRRLHEILGEHAAMLDAIVEGDAERAESSVQGHLRNAGAFLIGLAGPERQ